VCSCWSDIWCIVVEDFMVVIGSGSCGGWVVCRWFNQHSILLYKWECHTNSFLWTNTPTVMMNLAHTNKEVKECQWQRCKNVTSERGAGRRNNNTSYKWDKGCSWNIILCINGNLDILIFLCRWKVRPWRYKKKLSNLHDHHLDNSLYPN